jgi:hypothetical protein
MTMSNAPKNTDTVSAHQRTEQFVQAHNEKLSVLPLEGAWTLKAVGWGSEDIAAPQSANVVKTVGQVKHAVANGEYRSTPKVWTLTEVGRQLLETYRDTETDREMPCGHGGFCNERGTPYIQCPVCNGRWTKDELADAVRWYDGD